MIIPESILGKLKDGVTFVGKLYHPYDRMLKEIEKLPGIFTTVMKNLKN